MSRHHDARVARVAAYFEALTPADLQATAARYLDPARRLEIVVLPRGAATE